jgi:hypothetical protein
VLPKVEEWVMETVPCPPRQMLNWVALGCAGILSQSVRLQLLSWPLVPAGTEQKTRPEVKAQGPH